MIVNRSDHKLSERISGPLISGIMPSESDDDAFAIGGNQLSLSLQAGTDLKTARAVRPSSFFFSLLPIFLTTALVFSQSGQPAPAASADFFVATNGNENWTGK